MHAMQSVSRALRTLHAGRGELRADLVAGLPGAISSVPDGMAAAVLAGVNPAQGLYASFAGPIAGGLTSHSRLMVITTTSAAALAAGSALASVPAADRPGAVTLLALLAGAVLVVAGLVGLGRYTRFVSYSVMTGFLAGIAVNIIAGQIPDLTGAPASGPFALAKALDVLVHPSSIDVASLLTGLAALAVLVLAARTRWATLSTLAAIVLPTLVVAWAGASGVARVSDVGEIPQGIPVPHLPDLRLFSLGLLTGALAVAAIVLVQGAGVAEAVPNADGRQRAGRDITAQGVGNAAAGLFGAMPVGGSVGQSALNRTAGARTRWAAIFSGLWMLVILALFSGLVGTVVLPALAAVLVFAAAGSLRLGEVRTILRTGRIAQIALVATFVATLLLPVAAAVGFGIVLSLLLQLNRDALDLTVVEVVTRPDGRLEERPAPAALPSDRVTVLEVYGSLLYAGARTLQVHLPDPAGAHAPAVVIRLRGRTSLGATFLKVVGDYAARLEPLGGCVYLSGMDHAVAEHFRRSGRLDGPVELFEATPIVGASTEAARAAAESWLVTQQQ